MNRQQLKIFLLKTVFGIVLLFFISGQCFSQIRSSKRGIAYGYHSEADMAVVSKGISWWYNWYYQPESTVVSVYKNYGMDFVPMAWGKSFNEAGLRAFYANHPDAKYLLGFNEPNFLSQANMKPSEAAAAWPKLEKIAKDFGLKIVGPAVNYSGDPVQENGVTYSNPIAYLDAFFAACPNCQVDYIAVHNYMCYSGALSDYINQFKKYNKPIWLTEFACWDQSTITLSMQKGLMMGAIDLLESDPMVFRYSWFTGNRSGNFPYIDLFDAQSGKLTELGELYVNFNPVHNPDFYTTIPARIEAESYTAMSGTSIEATKDVSGIANVGWIDAGDWLEYNIDVPANGNYTFYFRISANATTNFDLKVDDVLRENVQVATTGGWQNWKTLQTTLSLSAGRHKVRIYTSKGMFNLNWLEIGNPGQPTISWEIQNSTFRAYPNPATDKLFIEREIISGMAKVQILDLTGRMLCEKLLGNQQLRLELDCSHLKSGSYLVVLKDENRTGTRLFVKE
ncbi:MAG: carbohydrate-binding protein [Prolixibacteraceae bacterium]|nr:carbohydrate-binding protein [Prolixibacteraceae bacterium]